MGKTLEIIESTAGQIMAELARRGIASDQRIMVTIEPEDWLFEARNFARTQVLAEGWTDADIDSLIEEERTAIQPPAA